MNKNNKINRSTPASVSVIIPVFNDAKRLSLCLSALKRQTLDHQKVEIVVVDNGSTDELADILQQFDNVSLIKERRPGSYCARNKGIEESSGEIIAFTDSDCIPSSGWLENGVSELIRDPGLGLVAGKIELMFHHPKRRTFAEIYESVNAFNQKRKVEEYHFGATANVFTRRSVIENVGIFNQDLKSGGDVEWGNRVYSRGYRLGYSDNAVVSHPARRTLKQLFKKTRRVAGGIYDWKKPYRFSVLHIATELYKLVRQTLGLAKRFLLRQTPSEKFKNNYYKFKYICIFFLNGVIRIAEIIRLGAGGSSNRA